MSVHASVFETQLLCDADRVVTFRKHLCKALALLLQETGGRL